MEVDAEFDLVISKGRSLPSELQVFLSCKQVLRLSCTATMNVRPYLLHRLI